MLTEHSTIAPPEQWQNRGKQLIIDCQNALHSPQGAKALDWLRQRGLQKETIEKAGIGYHPNDVTNPTSVWGLEGKEIFLPRGIVIPIKYDENLWGIRFRLPKSDSDEQKHLAVRGSVPALYCPVNLSHKKSVVLVSGVFDALTIQQKSLDTVIPVATVSKMWCRKTKWLAMLARVPLVLIAFDNCEAGEKAAKWWLEALGTSAIRWRPWWENVSAMCRDGADLQAWLTPALAEQDHLFR